MRVIYKPTGQVGDIPDNKFDAKLFTMADQPTAAPAPAASSVPAPSAVASQPSQSLSSQIGGGLLGLLKGAVSGVASPVIDSWDTVADNSRKIEQANPANGNVGRAISNAAGETGSFVKDFLLNPKVVADVGQFAVPFGKGIQGAGLLSRALTKAVVPGAVTGALQGVSQGENGQSVLGDAALGATGAGILGGLLKIPGMAGKTGNAIEGAGNALRQDVSKIQVDPSVFGASKEKTIQSTLDSLGIKGTAAQKYSQLEPAYSKLTDQIDAALSKAPKSVSIDDVKADLFKNLSQERSLDLSGDKAKTAVNDFIKSLYTGLDSKAVVPTETSTPDLFKLKQEINRGYGVIRNKIQAGQPLSPQEKVTYVARQTLDDIIGAQHPDVQAATRQQSNLHDAAASLANSRNAKDNVQIFGNTIPTAIVQGAKDAAGSVAQGVGRKLQTGNAVDGVVSNPLIAQLLGQASTRAGTGLSALSDEPANGANNPNNQVDQQQTANNGIDHNNSVPLGVNGDQNYPITPEMVSKAYQQFPQKAADRVKAAYDAQFLAVGGNKPLSETQQQTKRNADDALRNLTYVEKTLQQDPNAATKNMLPGKFLTRKFDAALTDVASNWLYIKTGKTANKDEIESIKKVLVPQPGELKDTVDYKLKNLRQFFQEASTRQLGVGGEVQLPQ